MLGEKQETLHAHPPLCDTREHAAVTALRQTDPQTLTRAAEIFRAASDPSRLRVLDILQDGEQCVSTLLALTGSKPSTLSQQLRLLRMEDLIVCRRSGKHIFYSLADQHISDLLHTVLAHASGECAGTFSSQDEA